jgi:hypothetical protein
MNALQALWPVLFLAQGSNREEFKQRRIKTEKNSNREEGAAKRREEAKGLQGCSQLSSA